MSQIRRTLSDTTKQGRSLRIGDLVRVSEEIYKAANKEYNIRSIHGNKKIKITGIEHARDLTTMDALEIVDIRTDKSPEITINKTVTYLVRVKELKNNGQMYIVPAMYLEKVKTTPSQDDDTYSFSDTVRRIHIRVIDHKDMVQPDCPWWSGESLHPARRAKIAGDACQHWCPLRLFSKGDYIYCRGVLGRSLEQQEESEDSLRNPEY